MTPEQLKRQYLEHLEIEKGRSLKTVANYDRYLSRFFDFSKINDPKDITDDVLREYRLWLNRQESREVINGRKENLKKNTQNYYLIALRSFLKYMIKRGIKTLPPERIELAKIGERSLDLITPEELNRLIGAPDTSGLKGLRDRAILELLFSTGLRVSELCSLPRDISLKSDEFSIRGKGEKIRVVFLSAEAKTAVKNYLDKRKDMDDALFVRISSYNLSPTTYNLRLTSRSMERIVKHYAIKAGISKKVTPHTIRHSFATDLLSNGADLRSVQALLGHSNITTTQIYTHVTDKQLRDVHKNFHSKGRK
ncbi:MAG: recombinase, integrase/recombinase XerD [Parcubacteria group bacterium]|nr:recombinase, integrase/recombinase XerD [Parcubacteria group bacterium]